MSFLPEWLVFGVGAALGLGVAGFMRRDSLVEQAAATHRPEPEVSQETQSQRWFDELLGALDAGVICIDARGAILAVNAAAARIFGSSESRMQGRVLIEATGSAELERRVEAARQGKSRRAEIEIVTSRQTLLLNVVVSYLPAGESVLVVTDITALRENERIRREFLGNVSHELRTPLAGLKLMVETLQAIDQPDTRAHFYPQIDAEIDRLVEIVEHLLEVARAESGRVEIAREPVALHELIKQALVPIGPRVVERKITLEEDLAASWFIGDANRITQVLSNLVENALRHTAPGGTITVSTRQTDEWTILEVADTGTGIPFKDLPHIFERFYVVDRSRAKSAAGLGLGLALVKAIVEGHGGTVQVSSEFGAGSRFTAYLPPLAKNEPIKR